MKNTNSIFNLCPTISLSWFNRKLALCTTIGMLLLAGNADALNWENRYGISITAGNDDNFRLTPTNELDTSFSQLELYLNAVGSSEITDVEIWFGIDSDDYSDSSIDGQTTGELSFYFNNQGERLQTEVEIFLLTEPSIETELLDTGLIVDSTRDTASISPGMTYQLDERNSLSINLGFDDVSYDTILFTEYQDSSFSLGWGYRLDETSDLSTSLKFSQYEPDNADSTDTGSFNFGYNMSPSETTTYAFAIGYSDVDGPVNQQTGSTYSVAINNNRDERNSFNLTAERSFQASGLGVVREEDRLSLSWSHAFSEKVQAVLSTEFIGTDDRDYFEIQPSINYRLSRNLSIAGNIRFRQQDDTTGDADSSSLLITLSYSR